jgi:hypothetical protein
MDRLKMQDHRTKTSARSHPIKKLIKKPLASSHQMKKLSIMVEEAEKKFDTLGEALTKLD